MRRKRGKEREKTSATAVSSLYTYTLANEAWPSQRASNGAEGNCLHKTLPSYTRRRDDNDPLEDGTGLASQ
jgi:hypothetical protein